MACQRVLSLVNGLKLRKDYAENAKFLPNILSKYCYGITVIPNRKQSTIYTTDPIDPLEEKFSKILIANRGEIACRVIKTCRAMGIKTVAVHSDVDCNAVHVRMADEAVCIGSAQAIHSYLKMDSILDAALKTQSDAIHPGYGFLSESAAFATKLEEHKIHFIGPGTKALTGMGDKLMSKILAKEAGVNIIPGFDGVVKDADECVKISKEIGFPVMIKASAGGGGKGMRIAWNEDEAREGFRFSTQEAASSFGDDRILVEKFIDNPRHIEIQVLADKHGNAVFLHERECSIQRRNQKVIEEAPSSFLDPETRKAMGEQAVALAKRIDYSSAGTVEFLVDTKKNFYFLEMNTRLQVEHPITECITGIDLVHQMIRIARGHKLKLKQENIPLNGWAIESRVYAEDPFKNFGMPSVGILSKYTEPTQLPRVRCDSGVREGSEISIYYDPMICKLVTYGNTRQEAIETQRAALDYYIIRGVAHNISLLRDIMSEPRFVKGDISTKYLNQVYPDGFKGKQLSNTEAKELASTAACLFFRKELHKRDFLNQQRLKVEYRVPEKLNLQLQLPDHPAMNLTIKKDDDLFMVLFEDETIYGMKADFPVSAPAFSITINGESHIMQLVSSTATTVSLRFKGTLFQISTLTEKAGQLLEFMPERRKLDQSRVVISPMPGLVKTVSCEVGDMVFEGQEVCVIEAMKMQNCLLSAAAGKVKAVHIKPGDSVEEEALLVELE